MMRSTARVPRPGTRSSISRSAAIDVDREALAMCERQGEFRIDLEIEHASGHGAADVRQVEAVEAQQPVGLVQPVFAQQRGGACGELLRRMSGRAEGGIIHALQRVGCVERCGGAEDGPVVGRVGANNDLCGLTGGREARRLGLADRPGLGAVLRRVDMQPRRGQPLRMLEARLSRARSPSGPHRSAVRRSSTAGRHSGPPAAIRSWLAPGMVLRWM